MRITSVKTKKLNDAANTRLIGVASAVIDNVFIVKEYYSEGVENEEVEN